MRVVIQRVNKAELTANTEFRGKMEKGLVVFLGFEETDTQEDIDWIIAKVLAMRIFSDQEGKMNCSLSEVHGGIMAISQFTLFASTRKGNRPGFSRSAHPDQAIPLYDYAIALLEKSGAPLITGIFGADMQVSLVNDGPVTIVMDSKNKE